MNNKLIVTLLFAIAITQLAFKPKAPTAKKNFVQINESVFLCKYEVSQLDYKAFLNSIKNDAKLYQLYYPDTTQWTKIFPQAFTAPWEEKYFWHPGFNNFPVVNITKEAAEAYCQWLNKTCKNKDEVHYRLPTEDEWLAGVQLTDISADQLIRKDGKYAANLKFKDEMNNKVDYKYALDGAMITASVNSYQHKPTKLCNLVGNVGEIVSCGKVVGGSWHNTYDESKPDEYLNYQLPDPRVGFRVVMEKK